jgi:hypothetical protein
MFECSRARSEFEENKDFDETNTKLLHGVLPGSHVFDGQENAESGELFKVVS